MGRRLMLVLSKILLIKKLKIKKINN